MSVSTETKLTLFENSNGHFLRTLAVLQDKLNDSSQNNGELRNTLHDTSGNIHDVKQYICDRIRNENRSIPKNVIHVLIGYIGCISTLLLFNEDIPTMHSDANRTIFDNVGADEFDIFEEHVKNSYGTHIFGVTETEMENKHLLNEAIYENSTMSEDNLRYLLKLFSIQTKKIQYISPLNQINCAMLLRRAMCLIFGVECNQMMLDEDGESDNESNE